MDNRYGHRQRLIGKLNQLSVGAKGIYTYELLEMLLFFVNKRKDTKDLAKQLLNRFKTVSNIFSAPSVELAAEEGIGPQTIILFRIIRELIIRMHLEKMYSERRLSTLDSVIKYCQFCMGNLHNEQLRMFCLNQRNSLITDLIIHEGQIDKIHFDIKEVIGQAIAYKASAIIIVHNHPSNVVYPSNDDIQETLRLKMITDELGIKLNDHIIITKDAYFSMKQMNVI